MSLTASAIDSCASCGIIAPEEQLVSRADRRYCPACHNMRSKGRRDLSELLALLAFIFTFAFYTLLAMDFDQRNSGRIILLGMLAYLALTCVHEAGHALMALVTRHPLVGVVIGHGPLRFFRFRIRGVVVEIRANLLGGTTHAASPPDGSGKASRALFFLGGVLAEATAFLVVYLWDASTPTTEIFRVAILVFAGYDVIANLWPREFDMAPRGRIPNDGKLLLMTLKSDHRSDQNAPSELEFTAADVEMSLFSETDDRELALERAAAAFEAAPERELNRYHYGQYLLAAGRWSEVLEVMTPLQDWSALRGESKAIWLNNLAWAALMSFDDERLAAADRWSEQAAELAPVVPAISNTRGAALILTGRPHEGMPLVTRAYRTCGPDQGSKALVSGFSAIGAGLQGDRHGARERYAAMIRHDPGCEIRREVERRIAQPEVAAFASLIVNSIGEIDVDGLAEVELAVVPARATLSLAWINGVAGDAELDDEVEVLDSEGRAIPASWLRAAARQIAAAQVLLAS